MEITQDGDLSLCKTKICVHCNLLGYSGTYFDSSEFGSEVELHGAACNKGSDCLWQAAFMAKAYENLPKHKLFLLEAQKLSASNFYY